MKEGVKLGGREEGIERCERGREEEEVKGKREKLELSGHRLL